MVKKNVNEIYIKKKYIVIYRRKDRIIINMIWGYGYLNVYCNCYLIFIIKKFIVFKFRLNMSFCSFDFEWNFFLNNLYKYVLYLIDLLLLFMMNDIVLGFLFVGVGFVFSGL